MANSITMYWHSLNFYRDACYVLLALGLTIMLATQLQDHPTTPVQNSYSAENSEDIHKLSELNFTSNDLSLSYPCAKNESGDHTCCFTLHHDRLIRSSIFDEIHTELLTKMLAWFTRPAYYSMLAPLWRPSILIAQRKLTI